VQPFNYFSRISRGSTTKNSTTCVLVVLLSTCLALWLHLQKNIIIICLVTVETQFSICGTHNYLRLNHKTTKSNFKLLCVCVANCVYNTVNRGRKKEGRKKSRNRGKIKSEQRRVGRRAG